MQGYLRAASQISRLAIGDRNASATSVTFKIEHSRSQMAQAAGAPIGTRGGLSVVHVFPADGDYAIKASMVYAALGGLFGRTPLLAMGFKEQVDVSIERRARRAARRQPGDDRDRLRPEQGPERDGAAHAADPHQGRPAAHLGRLPPAPRRPGRRPAGADREHRRGRRRLRHDHPAAHARHDHRRADEASPACRTRSAGAASSPAGRRRRVEEEAVRGADPQGPHRRAYRGKGTAQGMQRRDAVLRRGPAAPAISRNGIRLALQSILVSPLFVFRLEGGPGHRGRRHAVPHRRRGPGVAAVVLLVGHRARRAS